MIQEQTSRNVRVSGMGEGAINFSIDNDDFGFIAGLLTDKLYSDKVMAVIREYICNALDSNTEAKAVKPILITPPTSFEPIFKVRDYGEGLSFEFIEKIYVKLGKSTKRESNDTTGTFGIGAKSGFAYSDCFNITSWYKGICHTYSAQKDAASRLVLIPIGQFKSDEPSGIEISIPVNTNDVNDFRNKLAEFCRYISLPVEFSSPLEVKKINKVCDFDDFFIEESERYSNSRCKALMGNVSYPIDSNQLKDEFFYYHDVVLRVDIGEVDISPDREKLEYTPKTINTLNERFFFIAETVKKDAQKKIETLNHPHEITDLLSNLNSSFGSAVNLKAEDFVFRGRKIETAKEAACIYDRSYGRSKFRVNHYLPHISNISDKTVLIVADKDTTIYSYRFCEGYTEKYGIEVGRIIVSDSKDVYEKLMCDLWIPERIVKDFKPLLAKRKCGVGTRKASRNTWVYKNGDKSRWNGKTRLVDVSANKYYVVCKGSDLEIVDVKDKTRMEYASSQGIIYYKINKVNVPELDATWKPLADVVNKNVKEQLAKLTAGQYFVAEKINSLDISGEFQNFIMDFKGDFTDKDDIDAAEYARLAKSNLGFHGMKAIVNHAREIGLDFPKSAPKETAKKVEKITNFVNKYEFLIRIWGDISWRRDTYKDHIKKHIKILNRA